MAWQLKLFVEIVSLFYCEFGFGGNAASLLKAGSIVLHEKNPKTVFTLVHQVLRVFKFIQNYIFFLLSNQFFSI